MLKRGRDPMRIPKSQEQYKRDHRDPNPGARPGKSRALAHLGNILKTLSVLTTGGAIAIGFLILAGMWQLETNFSGSSPVYSTRLSPQPRWMCDRWWCSKSVTPVS